MASTSADPTQILSAARIRIETFSAGLNYRSGGPPPWALAVSLHAAEVACRRKDQQNEGGRQSQSLIELS